MSDVHIRFGEMIMNQKIWIFFPWNSSMSLCLNILTTSVWTSRSKQIANTKTKTCWRVETKKKMLDFHSNTHPMLWFRSAFVNAIQTQYYTEQETISTESRSPHLTNVLRILSHSICVQSYGINLITVVTTLIKFVCMTSERKMNERHYDVVLGDGVWAQGRFRVCVSE